MTRLEAQYPWMDDRSAWQETVGQEIPLIDTAGAGHGYWVTGNGRIFAARHNLPFTRLESILGPDYSREDDFTGWGAQEFIVRQHGAAIDWMTQTAFRIRRTAILGAECRADGLRLVLQDAVPPSWPIILRSIAIENTGLQSLTGLEIEVQLKELPANCHLVQLPNGIEVDAGGRKLRAITLFGNPIPDTSSFRIPLPTILTGDDFLLQIVLITGTNDEELSALAAKAARNPDDVPRAAYHWWQTWMSSTLTVASDDPRIGDLLDETTILTACQQAENGVIAPLTERSTSTAVDDLPVVRWLLSIGKSVEAARVLHARYSATCAQQSYATQIMAAQDGTLGEIEPEWR
ncbi:MAG TPA: hypothetical protein VHV83_22280, partial [Armatimonadota bacterium]|nr:hypothetical protein [Armatimonadota bacterium]